MLGLPSVFGTGVALYFGALFGLPKSWLDGLLLQYFVSPRQASGVFRGPGIHVMIRFKEIFWDLGGPRAWFCNAAVDCMCGYC